MSVSNKAICVRLLEKDFQITCEADEEALLREAAQYLDQKMMQIRQSGRIGNKERIAIMAALNVTYELMEVLNRLKVLQEKIDQKI